MNEIDQAAHSVRSRLFGRRRPMPAACQTCPANQPGDLHRLGLDTGDWDYVVALAGNPNTGKSTVFNALTGLKQHTGNWPGKTVSRAEGGFAFNGKRFKLIDLPGTYSLLSNSLDEEIARDFLLFGQPDVTVVVVDASRLERNLNLVLQVLEVTERVVVCLNLIDEAQRNGLFVDERQLGQDLGVPVVPTVARQGTGLNQLIATIANVAMGLIPCRPYRIRSESASFKESVAVLVRQIEAAFPALPNAHWVALRLLDGDRSVAAALLDGELSGSPAAAGEERAPIPEREAVR